MGARVVISNGKAIEPVEFVPADGAASPDIRALYDYWHCVRGEKLMPLRTEISLAPIKRLLKHIHMYDVVDGGLDFRTRVMGTDVFIGKGIDSTGKLLSEEPNEGARARLGRPLRHVVSTAKPVRVLAQRPGKDLYQVFAIESLWLPLGAQETVDQVLAMTIYTQKLDTTPEA
ncbi:MAG: PAS domain-containing protein [Alphaproteobacteria bacterium]|nr:PAS domain-containing protein [Alphaproteobacteria bacterium]